jgi:hypothetical protein
VLIRDKGELLPFGLEPAQRIGDPHDFGENHGGTRYLAEPATVVEQVSDVDHANHVVEIPVTHDRSP